MRIGDLGEFGLIERLSGVLGSSGTDVIVGIGDDVAVLRTSGSEYLLATCDAQVEDVHFRRQFITPYQLGRKTVAINVSDIAAMGGDPMWALVSLALPADLEVIFVEGLYEGMRDQMHRAGGAIVGGNMSRIRQEVVIDFALLGRVAPEHLVLRKGALEGDAIMVTGSLGDSRAGLEVLQNSRLVISQGTVQLAKQKHLTPQPRLAEGRLLGKSGCVHAMMDVSDGLASDIRHMCKASRVGALIRAEDLPVGLACQEVARAGAGDALEWALRGGEDYELLFSVHPDSVVPIQDLLRNSTGTECRVIGQVVHESEGIKIVHSDGRAEIVTSGGWDHFA